MKPVTCFISYSWDSTAHQDWVRHLADRLLAEGVQVTIDVYDLELGQDMLHFMEQAVDASDFVFMICTPNYAKKANAGVGGAGYEKQIIGAALFASTPNQTKFVPVLRVAERGKETESLPLFVRSKLYLDMRSDADFEAKLADLLRHVSGTKRKPAVGGASAPTAPAAAPAAPSMGTFFEPFDLDPTSPEGKARYGNLWLQGTDGCWEGSIFDGRHRLVNRVDPNAIHYRHFRIDDRDLSEGEATVDLAFGSDPSIPRTHLSALGLIYRFDRATRTYLGVGMSLEPGSPHPDLVFLERSAAGLNVSPLRRLDTVDPFQRTKLSITGPAGVIKVFVEGSRVEELKVSPQYRGDCGIFAMSLGELFFDNFQLRERALRG